MASYEAIASFASRVLFLLCRMKIPTQQEAQQAIITMRIITAGPRVRRVSSPRGASTTSVTLAVIYAVYIICLSILACSFTASSAASSFRRRAISASASALILSIIAVDFLAAAIS